MSVSVLRGALLYSLAACSTYYWFAIKRCDDLAAARAHTQSTNASADVEPNGKSAMRSMVPRKLPWYISRAPAANIWPPPSAARRPGRRSR